MRTHLQEMRKRAGFKSAKAFAEHIGMNVGTYTSYEQGTRSMTLETAWGFAEQLGCTLDELAGRKPNTARFADEAQSDLNDYYESMSDAAKSALVESAKVMSGNEG